MIVELVNVKQMPPPNKIPKWIQHMRLSDPSSREGARGLAFETKYVSGWGLVLFVLVLYPIEILSYLRRDF